MNTLMTPMSIITNINTNKLELEGGLRNAPAVRSPFSNHPMSDRFAIKIAFYELN